MAAALQVQACEIGSAVNLTVARVQVSRVSPGGDAIMAIGVDSRPRSSLKQAIAEVQTFKASLE